MEQDTFLSTRKDTINDDLASVYSGDADDMNEAAVRVAEYLDALATLIVEWAAAPGNHGGNPYTHRFVIHASAVYEGGTNDWHSPSCTQSATGLLRSIFEDALTEENEQ